MKKYIKTVLRDTFRRALSGFLLALLVPYAAQAMGMYEVTAKSPAIHPLWMAFFFGTFGGLNAIFSPVFEKLFHHEEAPKSNNAQEIQTAPSNVQNFPQTSSSTDTKVICFKTRAGL